MPASTHFTGVEDSLLLQLKAIAAKPPLAGLMPTEQHQAFDVEYPVVGHTVLRDRDGNRSLSLADTYYQPIMGEIVARLADVPRSHWPQLARIFDGEEPEELVRGPVAVRVDDLRSHLAALLESGFEFEVGAVYGPGAGPPAPAAAVLRAFHDFLGLVGREGLLSIECF